MDEKSTITDNTPEALKDTLATKFLQNFIKHIEPTFKEYLRPDGSPRIGYLLVVEGLEEFEPGQKQIGHVANTADPDTLAAVCIQMLSHCATLPGGDSAKAWLAAWQLGDAMMHLQRPAANEGKAPS